MKPFAALAACILLSPAFADEPAKPANPVKIADVGWLTGTWKGSENDRAPGEEVWSTPAGGGMMGMFRFLNNDKAALYEFMLLEQDAEGVMLRLRHYRPTMADVDKAPAKLRVTEATDKKIVFTNPDNNKPKRIVYERDAQDNLTVTVETERNGQPVSFPVKMKRVPVQLAEKK